jgi:chloramphenicol-sensitive protein RarD
MTPTPAHHSQARAGVTAVACAFFIWGLLPLYLKPLNSIAALEITAWRTCMGLLTVLGWMMWRKELGDLLRVLTTPALLGRLLITGSLLAVNWSLYAWGVSHGQVLITSLGYFINPLVNVLLGVVVLSERLNRLQSLAVAIATIGVAALTIHSGQLPWIALVLATTFSVYGLLRKTTPVAPLTGLACETLLVMPLALGYLCYSASHQVQFWPDSYLMQSLLVLSGIATIVPLALFNFGARHINYATVGMLQYIGPSLQFLIGYFIYRETLSVERLICFALIWLALLIYAGDSMWRSRKTLA